MSNPTPDDRLRAVEVQLERLIVLVEGLTRTMQEHVKDGEGWRSKMDTILHGDGDNPGLLIKHDRLEQAYERSQWVVRTIGATVLGLIVTGLYALLH